MENRINYLVKCARIYSLLDQKYSSPIGPYADILFFNDFLVLIPSDENSKESAKGAIGQFFGLLGIASTFTIDTIINKFKDIKFNKSLSDKLNDFENIFFASYRDIVCTLEEEKRPSFISFMYAQNTWFCFSGKFQSKNKSFEGRVAYREVGTTQKEANKKIMSINDLQVINSSKKLLIDDYLDSFLVNEQEGERIIL